MGLVLLGMAWVGVTQGIRQLPESETPGQIAQSLCQLAFGLFALLSLLTTFRRRRWNRLMLAGWTISVALAAGLASVFWGSTSILIGLASGAAALLIGLVVAWLLRIAARGLQRD